MIFCKPGHARDIGSNSGTVPAIPGHLATMQPILFPYTLLWGVLATPNQHLLTLPSSPVGKSSDLHAGVQQFKSHLGHKFFFFTYILSGSYSQPYFGQFST